MLPCVVVPRRDAVAPPELAADAPVLDVLHPVAVGVDPVRRARTARRRLSTSSRPRLRQRRPSSRTTGRSGTARSPGRCGRRAAPAACAAWSSTSRPCASRSASTRLARVVAVQAAVLLRRVVVDRRVRREDVDQRQAVALADLVVVEVVRGRDLDHAGAELAVDVGVGDDRDLAIGQRQLHRLADQVRVALVVRMHHHRGVAEHGFRARGRDRQRAAAVGQRVARSTTGSRPPPR